MRSTQATLCPDFEPSARSISCGGCRRNLLKLLCWSSYVFSYPGTRDRVRRNHLDSICVHGTPWMRVGAVHAEASDNASSSQRLLHSKEYVMEMWNIAVNQCRFDN